MHSNEIRNIRFSGVKFINFFLFFPFPFGCQVIKNRGRHPIAYYKTAVQITCGEVFSVPPLCLSSIRPNFIVSPLTENAFSWRTVNVTVKSHVHMYSHEDVSNGNHGRFYLYKKTFFMSREKKKIILMKAESQEGIAVI